MTEAEWLHCTKATQPVMDWLRRQRFSERKFHLTAAAVLRRIMRLLPRERYETLVLLIEGYADGEKSREELGEAQQEIEDDVIEMALLSPRKQKEIQQKQIAAAMVAAHSAFPNGFVSACNAISEGVRTGKRAEIWPWQCALLRDIFGNPFRSCAAPATWPSAVVDLAQSLYAGNDNRLILADALEETGHSELAEHFRKEEWHPKGCWVVDMILGKE